MAEREVERAFICISSSSEEEEDEDDNDQVEDIDDEEDDDDDDDGDDSHNDYDDDQEDAVDELEEEDDGEQNEGDDDESLCNKVIRFLKEGSDLDSLNLKDCKAYLRKHGLRISGTKEVCIQRIEEHRRLKDGNGEALYPRSSFAINCTGDVCKGDVVLFTQKVYEKFDKVTRHGRIVGNRTVAGRVVKESYGAAKQQHTFTVEVLWSRGMKKLCPLFPLLVKGRNLYKLRTFRQRWSNEAERAEVLDEKHRRGQAARFARATKRSKKWTADGGVKCQKQSHFTRPNQMRKTKEPEKGKHVDRHQKRTSRGSANHSNFCQQRATPLSPKRMNLQQNSISKASHCSRRPQKSARPNDDREPALHSQSDPPRIPHQSQNRSARSAPFQSFGHAMGSTSTMLRYPVTTNVGTFVVPASHFQRSDNSNYNRHGYIDPPFHPYLSGVETYEQRRYRDHSALHYDIMTGQR